MNNPSDVLLHQLTITGELPRTHLDWVSIEGSLNVCFPAEYRDFMDRFRAGGIFQYWGLYDPESWNCKDPFRLNADHLSSYVTSTEFRSDWSTLGLLTSATDGLLAIGGDCNGGHICMLVDRSRKNWPIVLIDRSLSIVEILYTSLPRVFLAVLTEGYCPQSVHGAEYWKPSNPSFRVFERSI